MKKNFILLILATILFTCCKPSPESVKDKIEDGQELSSADKKVIFEYMDEVMDNVETNALGHEAFKRLKEQFPYQKPFIDYLNKSKDEEIREMTANFIKKAKNNGKDKVYTYNPMYYLIMWRSSALPVNDFECELISEYVYAAFSSGYKGEEMKDHFDSIEAVMVNWTNDDAGPKRKKAINDGLDKAVYLDIKKQRGY